MPSFKRGPAGKAQVVLQFKPILYRSAVGRQPDQHRCTANVDMHTVTELTVPIPDPEASNGGKPLSPAAERALAEAAERRRLADAATKPAPTEVGGRGGLDPIRYGDWEKAGITSDF